MHPFGLGGHQALGVAKVWSGKARLPSKENMWKEYPGAGREIGNFQAIGEGMPITQIETCHLFFNALLVTPPRSSESPICCLVE